MMATPSRFRFEAQRYPSEPGCYLMKNARGRVIYVGKAKNLRRRLASYFQTRPRRARTRRMVAQIADIEVIIAGSEPESLLLESNLVKLYKPRFNVFLKDERSSYFYIVLTGEPLPRFMPYRRHRLNKQLNRVADPASLRRFGPYVSWHFRNRLLSLVLEHFQIRTCNPMPHQVCLRYHLGRCSGVCAGKVTAQEYAEAVSRAAAFLLREPDDMITHLKEQMEEYAAQLEFEKAQRLRDRIRTLEYTLRPQVAEGQVDHDQDAIYFGERYALVTRVKSGLVIGLDLTALKGEGLPAYERFLVSHYSQDSPPELIVNGLDDAGRIEEALSAANHYPVHITFFEQDGDPGPDADRRRELLRLCERNYAYRIALQNA